MNAPVRATLGAACAAGWLGDTIAASLAGGEFHPALHYTLPAQAAAWHLVHEKHTPFGLEKFYRDALPALAAKFGGRDIRAIISHGCGTGWKDVLVAEALGWEGLAGAEFLAADISPALVAHTARAFQRRFPRAEASGYVGDILSEQSAIRAALPTPGNVLHLFFGISPNILPQRLADVLRAALRPGDAALISFNLITERERAKRDLTRISAQYDNDETRAWLTLLPESLGLPCDPAALRFFAQIPSRPGEPAALQFYMNVPPGATVFLPDGRRIALGCPRLRIFSTYRYTLDDITEFLRRAELMPHEVIRNKFVGEALLLIQSCTSERV